MILPPSIRGLLFDKDGTLLDYQRTWIPINRELTLYAAGGDRALADDLLRAGGHDPETDIVTAGSMLAAGPHDELVAMLRTHARGRAPADLTEFSLRLFREGGRRHAVLLPGVRQTILELQRRGYVLGIATNDTAEGLEGSMGRVGLRDPFVFGAGCDSGHGAKPGPGMVLGFCATTGLIPAEVAMIGDSVHDLATGRAAGCGLNVGVLCGTSPRADLAALADVVLSDIRGLLG
jgi:phosphoglycolate phosphatase